MKDRQEKLSAAFRFGTRKIGDHKVNHMSLGLYDFCANVLNLGIFNGGDDNELSDMAKVFFSATLSKDKLVDYEFDIDSFNKDYARFKHDLEMDDVKSYAKLFESDRDSMEAAQVEPMGKDQAP